ncbi:Zinc finger RanBP2-type [Penicillium canariense]|uniref:Zinc finger RanBP2-type n=1 Tax=Penicillium canariense TaxID=189055 RepID=A0A9W9LPI3_9EURO|nr:Zinc finger RanBP2-type [Penicillium canariense]KAJ5167753.1 Zinc finger RanBP2-type [Penicillium canariense]
MRELDALISEYRHEKQRPRESEALFILRKVASMVKPIMRQRSWRVGALCEFYPQQSNLLGLNVNYGQKICLRLRYSSDQRQFLPIEQVVDTMLHELCHIVHGPHNRQFHALWNQLRDEHEELVMKGYTGEGFLSQGKRLGGSRIPLDEARRQARAAAEQRRTLAKNSGKRLGGAPVLRGTDIRKLRADAAQRRIEVTNGCASGTERGAELAEEASRNGFRTKAEEDDANEQAILQAFIELIQEEEREKYGDSYIPPSQENPAGPRTRESPHPSDCHTSKAPQLDPSPEQTLEALDLTADNSSYEAPWTCTTCTLENPPNFLCCDVCAAERPVPLDTQSTVISRQPGPANRTRPEPSRPKKRGLQVDGVEEKEEATPRDNFAFKNRSRALDTLASIDREVSKRPLGWLCDQCGSFMEIQWWTCSCCGKMKPSS